MKLSKFSGYIFTFTTHFDLRALSCAAWFY